MREHPDHHDAELLLRLYDLRREAKLRQAREWFMQEFHADTLDDLRQRVPHGSREDDFLLMVLGYWDMAASIVNHGLIKEEFFFENTVELWMVWTKVKHLVPAMRDSGKNPPMFKNLEDAAGKYEKWMEKQAPEALEAMHRLVLQGGRK